MINLIATATESGGAVASFGSGDSGGRTQASARGRGARTNASPAQVRALRARINREGTTGRSAAARRRRLLLQEIADNTNSRGNITRGALAGIASDLADL